MKKNLVKNSKDLLKLFAAMQEFSVQSLQVGDIVIQRGSPLETTQSPLFIPLHNPSDSAAGSSEKTENGTLPLPPPSPEDFETALHNLSSEFGL